MSYVKTQWVNNTTPINDTNLNKIEQGIYDNSLVVDAVTNTINPTDTETYKTAELTEGQITDVIGVNDILIKGQTSQDGEPTPSSPVDVNVVSGSNVINIENENNKNLFDGIFRQGTHISSLTSNRIINKNILEAKIGKTYTLSTNLPSTFKWKITNNEKHEIADSVRTINDTAYSSTSSVTVNCTENGYLRVLVARVDDKNITPNDIVGYKFQVEQGSTATTYEPHQGKELPLDLPVENLFNKDNSSLVFNGFANRSSLKLESNASAKTICQPCKPNTTYTISKILSARFYVDETSSSTISNGISITPLSTGSSSNVTSYTVTTSASAKYLLIYYYVSSADTLSEEKIRSSIQIEQGSKANAYTPYGTDPIELCKIGDYQDYFYKSGSKWYLHKEIGKKIVIHGDSNETWATQNDKYFICRAINNKELTTNWIKAIPSVTSIKSTIGVVDYRVLDNQTGYGLALAYEIRLNFENINVSSGATVEQLRAHLAENPITIYVAQNSTDTEITDTTLISQLEAIYNAPLYEQTNITQINNDLPMVLDITACKDNINGIKAWIRR